MIKLSTHLIKNHSYDSNNLETIKENYSHKFYGVKQAFNFMENLISVLRTKKILKKSKDVIYEHVEGQTVIYDFLGKEFLVFETEILEEILYKIYSESYFDLNENKLHKRLFKAIFSAYEQSGLEILNLDLEAILNWFIANLRLQIDLNDNKFDNVFSKIFVFENFPQVFFNSKNSTLMEFFFKILDKEKIIVLDNEKFFFNIADFQDLIKLIFGNFDLFLFSYFDNESIYYSGFELEESVFIYIDSILQKAKLKITNNNDFLTNAIKIDLEYCNDLDLCLNLDFSDSELKKNFTQVFLNKIKINNIMFGYLVNSLFCRIAIHTYDFTNSLYSEFFLRRWLNNIHSPYSYDEFWRCMDKIK